MKGEILVKRLHANGSWKLQQLWPRCPASARGRSTHEFLFLFDQCVWSDRAFDAHSVPHFIRSVLLVKKEGCTTGSAVAAKDGQIQVDCIQALEFE
jgi:hypothetical protein